MKLCIAIPALNEEKTIAEAIESIPKNFEGISKITIIVINDGSTDHTAEIAKSKGAIVINHKKNLGVGASFQSGLAKAIDLQANILVTIDADLQFDPKEIPKLLEPILKKEADLVSGSRFIDPSFIPKNMPKVKIWGNRRVANLVSLATGNKFHDASCGFRAYGQEAMLNLNLVGKFTYTQETLLELSFKNLQIKEVPIHVKYFDDRKSRVAHSLTNYAYKAFSIIFRTVKDYKPLKFFGISGLIIFFIGLGLDIFVLKHFFATHTFSPYKMIGFLGGLLNFTGIMVIFIGILADLIDKVRITQEKTLYLKKKEKYD